MDWGARIVFELFDRWKKDLFFFNNLRFLAVPVLAFEGSLDEDDGKTSRKVHRFEGLGIEFRTILVYSHAHWCWIRAL